MLERIIRRKPDSLPATSEWGTNWTWTMDYAHTSALYFRQEILECASKGLEKNAEAVSEYGKCRQRQPQRQREDVDVDVDQDEDENENAESPVGRQTEAKAGVTTCRMARGL
ncbi:GL11008 [Drosophila persimilis]|uniref:GL11008 n=1 Tax=Drosophila persimilis TaxID=7234 RepID=B4GBY0_DROPE|nr:GL11008 [Drosophila persimilis]